MKVPATPPTVASLMTKVEADRRLRVVVDAARDVNITRDYMPWDKVRFKEPPAGLSHEEWWLAINLARQSVRRTTPLLRMKDGRAFHYALPDEILQAVDAINRDASGSITVNELVTNPATRDRYVVSSLIEEAITSSQLEGAATSRRDAKEMIRSGRAPRDTSERMILNNYVAMQHIVEIQGEPLTPELVCEIHRIVTDGTLDDPESAGRLQNDDPTRVSVWGDGDQLLHRPPPAAELPARLEALCRFANERSSETYLPPVLRAISLHFMMGFDHYFEDGNGRTARAVFYWSMLNQGYWLTEFLTISRILKAAPAQYARSFLLTEQDDGDLTYFFAYQLTVVQRAITDLHSYLAHKAEEERAARTSLSAHPELNVRQLAVLDRARKEPETRFTARSHSMSHDVTNETARQDLLALEQLGYLVRSRFGRQHVWSARGDF